LISSGHALAQTTADPQVKPAKPKARASIYDKKADAHEQVAKATSLAKRDNKRVLLMFGGDWCGWCHKLHELFATNAEIRKTLAYEYIPVMIELESPHAPELLERAKAALSADERKLGVGYPFLAVLDSDGKFVTAQRTDPLEEGDHHDPKKVEEFLSRWVASPRDANAVVEEALARAVSADKRVFLDFGAPWCGWCHRLEDWLNLPEVATTLGVDFIVAKVDIDRMTHGKEVMSRYRPDPSGGIPWYTILDAKGQKLATADGPDGNIGYPLDPKEIDQFLAIFRAQSKNLEASHIALLEKSLHESAAKIKAVRSSAAPTPAPK
jgi:thiol-disulfide isomerase/thioredoxin